MSFQKFYNSQLNTTQLKQSPAGLGHKMHVPQLCKNLAGRSSRRAAPPCRHPGSAGSTAEGPHPSPPPSKFEPERGF